MKSYNDDNLQYFKSEEFLDILNKFQRLMDGDNSIYLDADEFTDLAEYYEFVEPDETLCDTVLDLAISTFPDASDPQVFRARKVMMNGDLDEAKTLCDNIPNQDYREVVFLHAEILLRQGESAEALSFLYNRSQQQDEQDRFLYDAGFILFDYHAYEEAHALGGILQQMSPNWFKTWDLLAAVDIELDNFDEALNFAEKMLDVDTFYVPAWEIKVHALVEQQRFPEATEAVTNLLAIEPDNMPGAEFLAEIYCATFEGAKAHTIYQHLIAIDDTYPDYYIKDAFCLTQLGRYDEAFEMLRRAEELLGEDEYDEQLMMLQVTLLVKLHRPDEALSVLDEMDSHRKEGDDNFVHYYSMRGKILAENHRDEEARQCFDKCLELGNSDPYFLRMALALLLVDSYRYDWAIQFLNDIPEEHIPEAETAQPAGAVILYKMLCYHQLHQQPQMLACLEQAMKSIENEDYLNSFFAQYISDHLTPKEYFEYYSKL